MDLESDDRQSRSGSVCCNGCESVCGRIDELPSGDHFPDRMLFWHLPRELPGELLEILIPIVVATFCRDKRDFDDHFHLCMYGRSGMRGSLFSDFRYDDHGICRCTVRSCYPCIDTASVCHYGGTGLFCDVYHCRVCTECMDSTPGWNRIDDRYIDGDQEENRKSRIKRKQTGDRKIRISYLCLKEHIVYEIKEIRFFLLS